MQFLKVPESATKFTTRGKYIPQPDGSLRLVQIQSFSVPKFRQSGWEDHQIPNSLLFSPDDYFIDESDCEDCADYTAANLERATRRAKINAFDIILSNPELDTFGTFTFRPEDHLDKSAYDQVYDRLRPWLSNRVQRNGLKYVIVPEYHKSGDIHFHGIINSSAVKLEQVFSPKTGRPLTRSRKPLYNITDWKYGFSTASVIGGAAEDRDKVAKYIFKYMGKQLGARIGGRYALIGGDLKRPQYVYTNSADELLDGATAAKYDRTVDIGDITYREWTFV